MSEKPTYTLPRDAGEGSEAVPVSAASTIVLRGDRDFEVLMFRRSEASTFVPGAWIFPGGAVEPSDVRLAERFPEPQREMAALRVCALREMIEEAGVWPTDPPDNAQQLRQALLGDQPVLNDLSALVLPLLDRFVWTSRWITPAGVPKRYDTWFFLVQAADGSEGSPDGREAMELSWITPSEALRRHRAGEMPMVFPTLKNLEAIAGAPSASELLRSRAAAEIPTMRPILVREGKEKRIVLPDER